MQRVGHNDPNTTLSIYTHVTKSMHDDVINKLNQRQGQRGNTYKLAPFLPPNRYSDKQSQYLSVVIAQYLLSPPSNDNMPEVL